MTTRPAARTASRRLAVLGLALALPGGLLGPAPASARDGDVTAMTLFARLHAGVPHRVVAREPILFAALDSGLATVDVTRPDQPQLVGHLYLPGPAHDVALAGDTAYVAAGEAGLFVVDVANPAAPFVRGSLATAGARAVAVAGTVAYVAEASPPPGTTFGLRTIDVSSPAAPRELGFVPLANGALDVALTGSTALVGIGSGLPGPHGLAAVDVTDPAAPSLAGFLATGKPVHDVALTATHAYLATGFNSTGALVVASLANPRLPALTSTLLLRDAARGVALASGVALVAARTQGLVLVDVSDPAAPFTLAALPTSRETVAVAAGALGVAYLGERASIEQGSVTAADTLVPTAPRRLSALLMAEATAVDATRARAYLLRRDALHVYDTSVAAAPSALGAWQPPRADFSALDVSADGLTAAVAEGRDVRLVDLTDPTLPVETGSVRVTDGVAVRPLLAGDTLYVVTSRGLESFNVAAQIAPGGLGAYRTSGWASALAVDGMTGYLVAGEELHVLDLSAPASPALVAVLPFPGEQLYGVAVRPSDDLLVVTGFASTLHVVDVANPAAPLLRASIPGPPGFDVVLAPGPRAVVAAGEAGLRVFGLADPAAPVLEASYDTSGTAASLAMDLTTVLLATVAAQHWVVHCDTCAQQCVSVYPTVVANSLKAVRPGGVFTWQVTGSGDCNLHRTADKSALPLLWQDALTEIATTPGTTASDPWQPGTGGVGFYQVFGRDSCSGASVAP